jgi:hypothetical protein
MYIAPNRKGGKIFDVMLLADNIIPQGFPGIFIPTSESEEESVVPRR